MKHISEISRPLQERMERATEDRQELKRQRISMGVEKWGWPPDAECFVCGDTGIIPDMSVSKPYYCSCEIGDRAETAAAMTPAEVTWENAGIPDLHGGFRLNTAPNQMAAEQVRGWIKKEPLRFGGGLILVGPTGAGKTALAVAAMRDLVFAGTVKRPLFWGVFDLFRALKETMDGDTASYSEIIRRCERADLLILDDLGQTRGTPWESETIEEIVDAREKSKSPTITTTNLEEAGLEANIGDRSVSRLNKDVTIIWVDGIDRRKMAGVTNINDWRTR